MVTALTSGTPVNFLLPPIFFYTLFGGEFGYSIAVPAGATSLTATLSCNIDVDLYMRHGGEPDVDLSAPNGILADYRSIEDGGFERIIVGDPRPGVYFLAFGVFTRLALSNCALTATIAVPPGVVIPPPPDSSILLTSGVPAEIATGNAAIGLMREALYRIDVPQGATRLAVQVDPLSPVNLEIYARKGVPPTVAGGSVLRDYYGNDSTGGPETLTITSNSSPPLTPGLYYIAIGLLTSGVPTFATIVATHSGGPAPVAGSSLTITVVTPGTTLPRAGQGRVELFTSTGASAGAPKTTDADRKVRFDGLANGEYRYRVSHTAGAFDSVENWGEQTVTVTGSTTSTFTRGAPYATRVSFFENANNQPIAPGFQTEASGGGPRTARIPSGTVVRAELSIASAGPAASAQLRLDRNRAAPYDIEQNCAPSSTRVNCVFTVADAGDYHFAYLLSTAGSITDSAAWAPAFTVAPAPSLVASANEIHDAAGFQRGNISPGSLATLIAPGVAAGLTGCAVPANVIGPLPFSLAEVSVEFRAGDSPARSAPLLSVCNSAGRQSVTFQIPFELPAGAVAMTVKAGALSATVPDLRLRPASPGLFTWTSADGKKRALVQRPDGSLVTPENPLRRGEQGRGFFLGLGPIAPPVPTNERGSAANPSSALLQVIIGLGDAGMAVVSAQYSTNLIGVYEVVFETAAGAATGPDVGFVAAVIAADDVLFSNDALISVQ